MGDTPAVLRPFLSCCVLLFWPVSALAATGSQLLYADITVAIILAVVLAVLMSRVLRSRGLASGLEFVALGYLLGPVLHLIPEEQLRLVPVAEPVLSFPVLGMLLSVVTVALGISIAFTLDIRWFRDWEFEASAEAMPIAGATIALLAGCTWWIHSFYPLDITHIALAVGCAAVLVSVDLRPAHIYLNHFNIWGGNRLFGLRLGTTLQGMAIVLAGIALALMEAGQAGKAPIQAAVMLALQSGLAVMVGLVARAISPERASGTWKASVALGAILFIAAITEGIGGSSLLMGFIAGLVWVQLDRELASTSRDMEPLIRVSLFVIAGLMWSSNPAPWVFAVALGWLLLRWGILRFYQRIFRLKTRPVHGLLWSAGALGIAIILEIRTALPPFEGEWSTGLMLAILFAELLSRRVFRFAMIDQGGALNRGTS